MMNLPCDIGQVPYHNVKFTRTASLKLALGPHFWQNEGHKRSWLFYGLALCQKRKPQVVSVSCFRESQERLCFLRRCGQTVYKKTIELCFCTFTYPELQKKDTSFIRSYRSLLNNFFVENIQIFRFAQVARLFTQRQIDKEQGAIDKTSYLLIINPCSRENG